MPAATTADLNAQRILYWTWTLIDLSNTYLLLHGISCSWCFVPPVVQLLYIIFNNSNFNSNLWERMRASESIRFSMPWLSRYSLHSHHITVVPHFFRSASTKSASLALRPYQESCLDACIDALKAGQTRIGVSLPTGSGKTTIFISLLSRIQPPPNRPKATRSLIVVNGIELARQSAAQVKVLFPDWSVEIEQGVKHNASGMADVYVCLAFTRI